MSLGDMVCVVGLHRIVKLNFAKWSITEVNDKAVSALFKNRRKESL